VIVEPTIVNVGLSLLGLILIYAFVQSWKKVVRYKKNLQGLQVELKKWQGSNQSLRQELTVAQIKLQPLERDSVTELMGWPLFEDRLKHSIKESERYRFTMALLLIDLDDFKVINDALNYDVGDALLHEVGERLQTCVRQVDSLSRFTKDTFAILLTQLAKPEAAVLVAQRILQALSQPMHIKGHELYVTACIGIAVYPTDGQDDATLLRGADHALHLAKIKGNHVYQFYQESLHAQSQRELALYTTLSRESIFDELIIYYQPIVNVEENKIMCMDAVLHWQHPEFGLIKSQELISLAERQRKVNMVSEWLLQHACKQYLKWHALDFKPALLGMSLSIKQLEHSHFIYRLSQIMQELGFKPEALLLEMKPSTTELSFEIIEKALNMLKYMGVKIAIDDFGTGLFSLRHLRNVAIHYLKLDALLTDDIDHEKAVALIRALVSFAQSLSMEMIAQGIQSEDQVALLKDSGCKLMQGGLFSESLSEQDVIAKMASFSS
jgi:diguanylate cyclase